MKTTKLLFPLLLALLAGCANTRTSYRDLDRARAVLSACKQNLNDQKAALAAMEAARRDAVDADARRLKAYREISQKLLAAFDTGTLRIFIRHGKLVVRMPNRILFDLGKAQLRPEGTAALGKIGAVLKMVQGREFLVAGHTDNVPVSKRTTAFKTNWELSQQRALTVLLALERQGVNPKQIAATGYGEHQPEATNDTEQGRARNRRTEFIVMPRIDELPSMPEDEVLLAGGER